MAKRFGAAVEVSLVLGFQAIFFEFLSNLAARNAIREPLHDLRNAQVNLAGLARAF